MKHSRKRRKTVAKKARKGNRPSKNKEHEFAQLFAHRYFTTSE